MAGFYGQIFDQMFSLGHFRAGCGNENAWIVKYWAGLKIETAFDFLMEKLCSDEYDIPSDRVAV